MSQTCTTADLGAVLRFVYSSGVRPRLAHPKARMSTFCCISRLTNGILIVLGVVLGAWPIGFLHQPQFAPLVSGLVMDGGVDIRSEQTPKSWPLSENRLEQLYSWLQLRRSHWRMVLATLPRPSSSILLTHSDGTLKLTSTLGTRAGNVQLVSADSTPKEHSFLVDRCGHRSMRSPL
jgi:hypothetical protein